MAYIKTLKDLELEKENQQTGFTASTGPSETTNATSDVVGQTTAAPALSSAPAQSGRFVNLQNYISANQPQAVNLGENVAGQIGKQVDEAKTAITTAGNTFGQEVEKGTTTYNKDIVNKAIAAPTTFGNTAEAAQFNQALSGGYQGPTLTSSTAWQPAVKEAQEAQEAGKLAGTAGGRVELLRDIAKTPYSQGGLSFNQLLLQNTEPARQKVAAAAEQTKPIGTELEGALTKGQEAVANAINTGQATRQKVVDDVTAVTTQFENELLSKVEQNRALTLAQQQLAKNEIANGAPSANTLAMLGLTRAQYDNVKARSAEANTLGGQGVDLSTFITSRNPDEFINPQSIATYDEALRYRALNSLIGNQGNLSLIPEVSALTARGGGATKSALGVDINTANAELSRQIETGKARRQAAKANAEFLAAQEQVVAQARRAQKAQQRSNIGSAIGTAVGYAVGGPVGGVIGSVIGKVFGGCFITTAIVTTLGKDDHCKELVMMRDLRDKFGDIYHKDEVTYYYQYAPSIVKLIDQRSDKNIVYSILFYKYITPCVKYVEVYDYENAYLVYKEMVDYARRVANGEIVPKASLLTKIKIVCRKVANYVNKLKG